MMSVNSVKEEISIIIVTPFHMNDNEKKNQEGAGYLIYQVKTFGRL